MQTNLDEFQTLVDIMKKLRGPGGCPWDQEQTHKSLAPYALEEASELSEAIHDGDPEALVEELGDLLLQVVFHAELGRETGQFTIADVVRSISEKLIRRHPHVFSDVKVANSQEVTTNWEKIKAQEKQKKNRQDRMDVPLGLPALQRAQKIGDRTKKEKFDWSGPADVMVKLKEEMSELEVEWSHGKVTPELQNELGDVLFTAAQLARHLKFDAEQTLREANRRFEGRYLRMRSFAEADGKDWAQLTDPEKESYWSKAKKSLSVRST